MPGLRRNFLGNADGKRTLSPDEENLIEKLIHDREEFEIPSEQQLEAQGMFDDDIQIHTLIADLFHHTVMSIINFGKSLPELRVLINFDQITLLKGSLVQNWLFRKAQKYDVNTDSIVYANRLSLTRSDYSTTEWGKNTDRLFDFFKNMADMKVDNVEYVLLSVVVTFSDQPDLEEPEKVKQFYEKYLDVLRKYVEMKRPDANVILPRLLSFITETSIIKNLYINSAIIHPRVE